MPFRSKRQWRAAFAGQIPGLSREKAREWARETRAFERLPGRAPDEKGEPTLRSKKKESALLMPLIPHFTKLAQMLGAGSSVAPTRGVSGATTSVSAFDVPQPTQVARGAGDFTPNRPKKPGMPLRRQAVNPRLRVPDAMSKGVT